MAQKQVSQKDLATLMKLNLLDVLGVTTQDAKQQEEFMEKFHQLSWMFFFQTDGKDLSEEEVAIVEEFIKQEDIRGARKYLTEKFPNFRILLMKNALLAKKLVIIETLDTIITLIKAKAKAAHEEDSSEDLVILQRLADEDKWEKFVKLFVKLKEDD